MTVTCHYIVPNLKLQNFLSETLLLPQRHTGVDIAEKLKEVGERWGITYKVKIVSHDHRSNVKAAMGILTEDGNWQSLPCCAHPPLLCLSAGLTVDTIDKCTVEVKTGVNAKKFEKWQYIY